MTDARHKASVTIEAKVDAADRDIRKLTRRIDSMQKALDKADRAAASKSESLKQLAKRGVAVSTAVVGAAAGLFKLAESSAAAVNETAKVSRGLGVTTQSLQRLEFATSRATKATNEQLHKAISTLTVGLQDAVTKGTGPVAEGLQAIGVSAFDLRGLSIDEQFAILADEISRLPIEADRSAVAMKLFGKRAGSELAPLMLEGSAGLKTLGDEAERLGIVLDDKAVAASEEFIDSVSDMKLTLGAVARDVGLSVVPAFKDAADGVKEWTVENRELIDQDLPVVLDSISTGVATLVGHVATAVEVFASAKRQADSLAEALGPVAEFAEWSFRMSNPTSALMIGADSAGQIGDSTFAGSARGGLGASLRAAAGALGQGEDAPIGADFGPSLDAASESVRKAQAKLAKGLGETKKGARGARKEVKSLLETMLEADQARMSAFSDDADFSFLGSGLVDPFSGENREIGLQEMARHAEEQREIERVRREGLLQDELEHLELRRELGADPIALIEQETQARLEFNDFLQSQADGEADRLRLQNDRRRIAHDQEMARLKAEQQAQRQRMVVLTEVSNGIDTMYRATAEAALASAFAQGESVREAVHGTAKAEAMRATITAGASFVQAAFWSAVPGGQAKAAQFVTAGTIATAQAAAFGAIAGGLSGGGGGRGGGGGGSPALTGASFGAGSGPSSPQSSPPAPSSLPGADSSVPGSQQPTGSPGAPPSASGRATGSQSVSFDGAVFNLYGAGGQDDFIEGVTRGQERLRLKRR